MKHYNWNIQGFHLFNDELHLLESEKRLLDSIFTTNFNNFMSVMGRSNKFTEQKIVYTYINDMSGSPNLDISNDTPLVHI